MKTGALVLFGSLAFAPVAFAQGVNDAGKLAESMASSPEVKKFGKDMMRDHTGINKSAVDLVTRLKVTPEDNPTAMSLKKGGAANVDALKTMKGTAFDKAYIDHEVAYHEQVLEAMDKTLIPGAKNDELKALLVKVRPTFASHLAHAKMLQTKMMSSME
jgi:putative membrane protein